jgi:hypothetical protein
MAVVSAVDDLLAGTVRSHRRLLAVASVLDENALVRHTVSGWTVAATLTHIAFYDDFVSERWRRYQAAGSFQDLPDDITDLINAAGERGWQAVDPIRARTIVIEAADAVSDLILHLPQTALVDALKTGRAAMVDRSLHWDPHLDEIEQALSG